MPQKHRKVSYDGKCITLAQLAFFSKVVADVHVLLCINYL